MSLLTSVQAALDQRDRNLQAKGKLKLTPDLGLPMPEKKSVPQLAELVRPKTPVLTGQVPPTPAGKQGRQMDEAMRRRGKGVRIQRTGNIEADAATLAAKEAEVQPYTDPALMELGQMVRGVADGEEKSKQLIYRGQRIMGERGIGPQEAFDLMMGKRPVEAPSGMPDGREAAMRFIRGAEAPQDPNAPMNDPLNMIHNAIGRAYSTVTGQPWEDIDPRSELSESARNLFMTGVYSTPVLGVVAGLPELLNMAIAIHQAPDKGAMVEEMARAMGEEVNVSGVDWNSDAGMVEGFRRIMNIPMAVTQLYDVWRLGKAIAGKRARTPALPEPEANVPFQATEPGTVYGQKVEGVEPGSMPLPRGGKGSTATSQIPDGSPAPKVESPNSSEIPNGLIPEKSYKFSGAKEPSPRIVGTRTRATTPDGKMRVDTEYQVVERGELIASNDAKGNKNPAYKLGDLQPRERSDKGQMASLEKIAQELDPELLMEDFKSTDRGAPVVGPDGLIESGNGRVMSLDIAKDRYPAQYKAYQDAVRAAYPDAANMKDPVVIQRRLTELDDAGRVDFARRSNKESSAALRPSDQAKMDADLLTDTFLNNFEGGAKTLVDSLKMGRNRDLVRSYVGQLPAAQQAGFFDSTGELSPGGAARLGRAVLAKVLGPRGADTLNAAWGDGELGQRVVKGIEQAAPALIKLRQAADGGNPVAQQVADVIVDALQEAANRRNAGKNLETWYQQGSMLDDGRNPLGKRFGLALESAKSQLGVTRMVNAVADAASDSSGGLFGDDLAFQNAGEVLDAAAEGIRVADDLTDAEIKYMAEQAGETEEHVRRSIQAAREASDPFVDADPTSPQGEGAAQVQEVQGPSGQSELGKRGGFVEPKTLAKIAGLGITGGILATGVARGEIKAEQAIGVAAGAGVLAMGFRGAKAFARKYPGVAAMALPPEDAARLLRTGNTGQAIAGNALDMILNVEQRHTLDAGETIRNMRKVYEDTYGKKFADDPKWKARDEDIRTIMEKNLDEGRPWSEGLSDQEMKVVQWLKENVGDPILDRAEKAGIMPKVTNNGQQSSKMVEGKTKVRLANGATGTFMRAERLANGGENLIVKLETPPKEVAKRTKHLQMAIPEEIILEPGTTFYRQFDRIGEAFVPRIPKAGFYDKVRAIKDRKGREALARMLRDQNPGRFKGMDTDEILGTLDGLDEGLTMDSDVSDWLANLDTERQLKLARFEYVDEDGVAHTFDPYQSSHLGNWIQYADRSLLRVHVAEVTGTPNPAVIGQYIRSIPDPALQHYVKLNVGRILGLGDLRNGIKGIGSDLQKIASVEGASQTVMKLTGGTTVISQLSDLVQVGTEAGFRKTAKALWEVMWNADLRDEYAMRAAADQNFLAEFRGTEYDTPKSVTGKIVKGAKALGRKDVATAMPLFADAVMTGLGIRAMDKAVKATTLLTAQREAARLLELGKKGKLDAVGKRKLERMGLTSNDAKQGAAALDNREVQYRFTGAVRRSLMYTGTPDSVPVWASGPLGSMAFRFKKPALFATRFIVRNVANEAAAGNFQPMARFILGAVGVGQASTMLKDLVRGEKDPLANTFFNKKDAAALANLLKGRADFSDALYLKSLGDLLWVAGKNMYDAGALGLPGDFSPYNRRAMDIGKEVPDPWQAMTPLTPETITRGVQQIGKVVANENWTNGEWQLALKETEADIAEYFEQEIVPLRRFMDFTGIRPEVSKVRKGERELRKLDRRQKELLDRGDYKGASELVKEGSQFQEAMKLKARVEGPAAERKKAKGARAREIVPLAPSDAAKVRGLNKDGTRER